MKSNETYMKNGRQCFMCPIDGEAYITQFAYGSFSHQGSTAIDVAKRAGEKAPYYAPADMVCVKVDKNYCFTWWQTIAECYLADGTVDHATLMCGHDESINAFVGLEVKQGEQIGNMGAGGTATGVHCHLEVAKGHQNSWVPNTYGVYVLPNASLIEQICFMDDCSFTNMDMEHPDFHYTNEIRDEEPSAPETSAGEVLNLLPEDFMYEQGMFTASYDELRIRRAPSLKGELTGDWYNENMSVHYDGYVKREGYVWISWIGKDTHRHWMAAGELNEKGINSLPYGTFQ